MIGAFGDNIKCVHRIKLPEQPTIYLYEVQRHERAPLFVIWEKRNAFSGEDKSSPTPVMCKWRTSQAHAMDVFGQTLLAQIINGYLHLSISHTPVFIEP